LNINSWAYFEDNINQLKYKKNSINTTEIDNGLVNVLIKAEEK